MTIDTASLPVRQLEVSGEYSDTKPANLLRHMANLLELYNVESMDEIEGIAFRATEHADGEPSTPVLSVFVHETPERMGIADANR